LSGILNSQVPQGFNYQAIARDPANTLISNRTFQVRVTLQTLLTGGTVVWQETHSVTSTAFGVISFVIGNGTRTSGSAALFADISWGSQPLFIKTEIQYPAQEYVVMGTSQLWSVPYSLLAKELQGPVQKLGIAGKTTSLEEALFEVKNNTGQTIFAVYNEGVRVYVDDGAKGSKGGFAIGGFGTAKAVSQNLLTVSPDSVRIYVDETVAKGNKGGFAIGGFNAAKGTVNEFMMMTPENYFIGHRSGQLISSGVYNSTLGFESGKSLIEGSSNVFLGYKSGYMNTAGNYNIFLGREAGYSNTASSNIFVGDLAAYYNTTGDQNVIIGDWAGYHNTTGFQNVVLGANAGWFNTTGSNNIFMGFESGYSNTTGFDNINIGNKAGRANTDGTYNVMIGSDAGTSNSNGDFNTMIGYKAGENATANYGTMLGYLAGNSTTTGFSQVMLGYMAGSANTGAFNTYVGTLAGGTGTTGSYNTYVGLAAGNEATGNYNVFIGKWAGWSETGSSKLIIESGDYSGTDNYNNALIYGDFFNRYMKVNGQLLNSVSKPSGYAADFKNTGSTNSSYGLNITAGTLTGTGTNYYLDFNSADGAWKGSVLMTNGNLSFYNVSDARLKENIIGSGMNALNLLNNLKVVDFNFISNPGLKQTGYIAQDAQKVIPEMVVYNEKADVYGVSTSTLIPVLHKAINEQQVIINNQKTEIESLKSELDQIKALLEKNGIK